MQFASLTRDFTPSGGLKQVYHLQTVRQFSSNCKKVLFACHLDPCALFFYIHLHLLSQLSPVLFQIPSLYNQPEAAVLHTGLAPDKRENNLV